VTLGLPLGTGVWIVWATRSPSPAGAGHGTPRGRVTERGAARGLFSVCHCWAGWWDQPPEWVPPGELSTTSPEGPHEEYLQSSGEPGTEWCAVSNFFKPVGLPRPRGNNVMVSGGRAGAATGPVSVSPLVSY
jgi:hypothetical protein